MLVYLNRDAEQVDAHPSRLSPSPSSGAASPKARGGGSSSPWQPLSRPRPRPQHAARTGSSFQPGASRASPRHRGRLSRPRGESRDRFSAARPRGEASVTPGVRHRLVTALPSLRAPPLYMLAPRQALLRGPHPVLARLCLSPHVRAALPLSSPAAPVPPGGTHSHPPPPRARSSFRTPSPDGRTPPAVSRSLDPAGEGSGAVVGPGGGLLLGGP